MWKWIKPRATTGVFYLPISYSSRKGLVKMFPDGDDEVCSLCLSNLPWLVFYLWSQVGSCALVLCLLRHVLSSIWEWQKTHRRWPHNQLWCAEHLIDCCACLQLPSVLLQRCYMLSWTAMLSWWHPLLWLGKVTYLCLTRYILSAQETSR